jgi:5-methylcytosine-specific restriction endonuclease McrA
MYKKNYKFFLEGARWDREQTDILMNNFNKGKTIQELTMIINEHIKSSRPGAVKTIRTFDSVAYKLKNLGLISEEKLNDALTVKRIKVKFNRLNSYDDIKKEVFDRDKNTCVICGSKNDLQMAHVVPFRETFKNLPNELVTLCKKDHKIFDELNEYETKKVFEYMCKLYPDYSKKYKVTYRYNPITNKDLCEVKRLGD